jgi:hypothetical protein
MQIEDGGEEEEEPRGEGARGEKLNIFTIKIWIESGRYIVWNVFPFSDHTCQSLQQQQNINK